MSVSSRGGVWSSWIGGGDLLKADHREKREGDSVQKARAAFV